MHWTQIISLKSSGILHLSFHRHYASKGTNEENLTLEENYIFLQRVFDKGIKSLAVVLMHSYM